MKDLADFIRALTPSFTDKERYTYISKFHLYIQLFIVFVFFYFKSIVIKLFVLLIVGIVLLIEITYKECPISMLEREFHTETWDDILDLTFKYFKWEIKREEKVVGFICFNIGIYLAFSLFTVHSILHYVNIV